MHIKTQGWKATLILCLTAAVLASLALTGLSHAQEGGSAVPALRGMVRSVDDQREPEDAQRARIDATGRAIDHAASTPHGRALLLAVGWHESRFSHLVCQGHETGDDGAAWGCWQSWDRDRSGGIEGQAIRARVHLRKAGNWCAARGHERLKGAISLYATGKTCEWPGADERAATYWAMRRRLAGHR